MYPPENRVRYIVCYADVIGTLKTVPGSHVKNLTIVKHKGLFNPDLYYETLSSILHPTANLLDLEFVSFDDCITKVSILEEYVLKEHYETV